MARCASRARTMLGVDRACARQTPTERSEHDPSVSSQALQAQAQRNGKREFRWALRWEVRTAGSAKAPVQPTGLRPRLCKSRSGPS